ncbi:MULTISPECIES: ScbR family autoregulator-binding transcription factor [Streptomyces]|jgi:AcrR family transcriptional regulator|uniref:ScbR family autoregulator-binding transcription factor n=1 Tax=Streptomyces doudnae TaxID=3075536 RepID=A0ABD5EW39_9ACTN|nr:MULTISPECIES: ScbR family autoregulator-binding transcription factor [unclassified Streptomyces]MDT0438453.1 ScbR family autoregulator-binding transcription factor [Streptomyces sp. DSM 41981]MYQ66258.1 TetR family transcriptional regulator [Streptomyces sp. SID4950]SCE17209.1 transcriptional regulator, TetR family [Streptomyces sp. SolWspMP-5a-2]
MVRQLRAEQTRATIITAAADLFDRCGYESTSLSDIVEHAHVTKGALYFHFAAKEDLAHAIMEIQSRTLREVTTEMDARGHTCLETLMRITFGIARLSVEGPVQRAGLRLATGPVEVRPPLTHPFTEWRDIAARKLHGAMKESDIHPDIDVEAVAHALVSWFVGTRVVGRSLEPVARQPRRVAEMWHVMIRGMVPVTRRARYLNLASRLEREIRPV